MCYPNYTDNLQIVSETLYAIFLAVRRKPNAEYRFSISSTTARHRPQLQIWHTIKHQNAVFNI
ncbi:hypothetical protein D1AOALGA4SA_6243 [Olavius algarvensis Delta 1 endosymbiont]|nr:hypothetical protein D1AOALGA4SA_6243 [Olavius algarvensis Delta 1 endosymbiont]